MPMIETVMSTKKVRVLLPTKLKSGKWVWLKRVTRRHIYAETPMMNFLGTFNVYSDD